MDEPLNLVLFSGTDDKLQAAAVLTAGAAALGKPVNVFLQYWALDAFRARPIGRDHGLAPEAGEAGRAKVDACAPRGQASWADTLRQAKDLGGVDIQACSLSMDLLGLEPERPRPARRRRRGRDRLLPQRRRGPGRLHLSAERRHTHAPSRSPPAVDARGLSPARCRSSRPPRRSSPGVRASRRGPRHRPGLGQGLRRLGPDDRATSSSSSPRTAASSASSSARREAATR